jgi:hypothetical protein
VAVYRNFIYDAILRKSMRMYPPDQLANGPDRFLKPVVSPAYANALFAAWAPTLGNQSAPAVDPLTNAVERGYYEELPWDE